MNYDGITITVFCQRFFIRRIGQQASHGQLNVDIPQLNINHGVFKFHTIPQHACGLLLSKADASPKLIFFVDVELIVDYDGITITMSC